MQVRGISLLAAFAACFCSGNASATTFHGPVASLFELKPAESVLFQQIACTDRYGVSLEKAEGSDEIGSGKLDDSKSAYVVCKPHRRIEGQPVKYLVDCRRADLASAWECDPGREYMLARAGGIQVHITIGDSSPTTLDQAFVVIKYLRSSGQINERLIEESEVPGEEGSVSCRTFPRYSDHVEMVRCSGVNDTPVAKAQELQP